MKKGRQTSVFTRSLFIVLMFASQILNATDLNSVLEDYAKSTGKVIIAPDDMALKNKVFGELPDTPDYAAVLAVLDANGLTAYQEDGRIIVIPVKNARFFPMPVSDGETAYPAHQFVTELITPSKACSVKLIPLLRPLVPKTSHMAAQIFNNTIVLTDRYENIQRIKGIIADLDDRLSKSEPCRYPSKSNSKTKK